MNDRERDEVIFYVREALNLVDQVDGLLAQDYNHLVEISENLKQALEFLGANDDQ